MYLTTDPSVFSIYSSKPSLLEYLSYNINFLSILVGPCSIYKDYIEFIKGQHVQHRLKRVKDSSSQQNGWDKVPEPSPVVRYRHINLSIALEIILFIS